MTRQYRWPRSPLVSGARAFIRIVSLLIPSPRRQAIVAEWEGELWTLVNPDDEGPTRSPMRVTVFCLGFVPHAVWARRDAQQAVSWFRSAHGRRARGLTWLGRAIQQDASYALRTLAKRAGFSLTAIGIIALGIGATTTIYSVVDRVLLRGLPYDAAHELVFFENGDHSPLEFLDWRDRTNAFAMLAGSRMSDYNLTGDGEPARVRAAQVTPDFFTVFGGSPALGRLLTPEDYATPPRATVLDFGFWQRRWGGDPSVVGKSLIINGDPVEVVGILSPAFEPPEALTGRRRELWLPFDLEAPAMQRRGLAILRVAGRLEPNVTMAGVQAQLNILSEALAQEIPDRYQNADGTPTGFSITSLFDATIGEVADGLFLLLGAVGLMLLIACANVANLLLARGAERGREVALRTALGASRRRVVSQLLTESVVLSSLGGMAGVVLAMGGVWAFKTFSPGDVPRAIDLSIDARILAATVLISVITGVVFGILPALQAARSDVNQVLKEGSASVTDGKGGRHVRNALVVGEIAMALVLLTGAGLFYNSFMQIRNVDPGIETHELVTVPLALNGMSREQRAQFVEQVLERIRLMSGIRAAGAGTTAPFVFFSGGRCCWSMDFSDNPQEVGKGGILHPVTAGYFAALGATLVRGRAFSRPDRNDEPIPTVLTVSSARQLFPDRDALDETLYMNGTQMTIVGIVNDIRHWGLTDAGGIDVYVPHAGRGEQSPRLHLVVRSSTEATVLGPLLREAIWAVNPDLPVPGIVRMTDRIAQSVAGPKFFSMMVSLFATVALLLAAGGIYSAMLYSVQSRYRELGLRIALGARSGQIVKLILRQGLWLVAGGTVLGLLGAMSLSGVLETMVFGVSPTDLRTLTVMAGVLATVALVACYVPARKAANADPIETLRAE